MDRVGEMTGRHHKLVEYYGPENPESITILMGSGAENVIETIDYMNAKEGKNWGVIKLTLYRPWPEKYVLAAVPKSVKRITVLDKTVEEGSSGLPLYLDVL
jgi:pyruvate-ferredoxin/flavodoxin oxidoreductase